MTQLQQNLQYLIYTKHKTNPTRLARETGVSQPTIKRILDGDSEEPRYSSLIKLAEYFGMTVEFLRTGPVESHDQSTPFELVPPPSSDIAKSVLPYAIAGEGHKPGRTHALSQAVKMHLPASLHVSYRKRIEHDGRVQWADYSSPRLLANFIGESKSPERHLWRLAVQSRTIPAEGPRRLALIILRIGERFELPDQYYDCLKTDAALFGIEILMADSPFEIARMLEEFDYGGDTHADEDSDASEDEDDS
jgi:transcriptional regulator with XRE-family HTH domain